MEDTNGFLVKVSSAVETVSADHNIDARVGITLIPSFTKGWHRFHVGITSLIGRFGYYGPYLYQLPITISRQVDLDDKQVLITMYNLEQSLSSAAIERSVTMSPNDDVGGIMFCYDITYSVSWDCTRYFVERFLKELQQSRDSVKFKQVVRKLMILGCKCDLEAERQVDFMDVQVFADEREILFMEASATEDINVDYAFVSFAAHLLEK